MMLATINSYDGTEQMGGAQLKTSTKKYKKSTKKEKNPQLFKIPFHKKTVCVLSECICLERKGKKCFVICLEAALTVMIHAGLGSAVGRIFPVLKLFLLSPLPCCHSSSMPTWGHQVYRNMQINLTG